MAQRDLTVRLRADIGQYRKAMADASKSTDQVARAGQALQNAGGKISSVGDNLTKSVTVPMALAGVAAVKMAGDFDQAFTQMVGLAGVSASEVDGLKDSVLDLAGETGRAPQELAEGLLMIRSAGLSGQDALDVLEASAKAAATGMGDTATVANALTNVMNGYGAGNITAAEAMDVLTASVREGKAEAQDMAPQFGRLVPIAAELGVSFGDVAGSMAFLTKATGDASQSSTALQGILSKLLRPSQQGAQALEEVGISGDGVRQMLGEKGLHGTLVALRERLGDNGFQLLFDDVQALNGALQMTGPGANDAAQVIDRVTNSAGSASDAFANWAESMGAKNAQAFAQFQVALIRVGETLAPIAADVLSAVASIAEAFSGLPDGAQKTIIAIAAIAAAVGPLMSVGGRLVSVWGGVMKVWSSTQAWTAPAKAIEGAFNTAEGSAGRFADTARSKLPRAASIAAKGIAGLAVAFTALEVLNQIEVSRVADDLEDMTEGIDTTKLDGVREALRKYRAELDELDDREGKGRLFSLGGFNAFATEGDEDRQERIDQLREKIGELEASEESLAGQQAESAAAFAGTTAEIAGMSEATTEAVSSLQEYADALTAQFDPLFGMAEAMASNREAQAGVTEAQNALNEAVAEYGASSPEAAAAQEALSEAQRAAAGSALDVYSATAQLNAAIAANPALLADSKAQLDEWVVQGLISRETANAMAAQFDQTAWSATALGQTDPDVAVSQTGAGETRGLLDRARDAALSLGAQRPNVHASASGADDTRSRLWSVRDAAFSIPTSRNIDITATITSLARGIFPSLRAEGGPVRAGEAYIVGEKRPELFIPDQDGTILPSVPQGDMFAAGSPFGGGGGGGGGGGRVDVGLHITGSGGLAQMLGQAVRTGEVQLQVNGQRVRVTT